MRFVRKLLVSLWRQIPGGEGDVVAETKGQPTAPAASPAATPEAIAARPRPPRSTTEPQAAPAPSWDSGLVDEVKGLADRCPELNMANYGEDDVDRLNDWAIDMANSALALALSLEQCSQAQSKAGHPLQESARLDWLLSRISVAELRRIGLRCSDGGLRCDLDAAIRAESSAS